MGKGNLKTTITTIIGITSTLRKQEESIHLTSAMLAQVLEREESQVQPDIKSGEKSQGLSIYLPLPLG